MKVVQTVKPATETPTFDDGWVPLLGELVGWVSLDADAFAGSFADLGGSSLQAYTLASAGRRQLGLEVDVARLLGTEPVAVVLGDAESAPPVPDDDAQGLALRELLPGQLQMLTAHAAGRDSAYHLVFALSTPVINATRAGAALDGVVADHQSLRTWFVDDGEVIGRRVGPLWRPHLEEIELPPGPEPSALRAMDLVASQSERRLRPFDGPAWFATLVHTADGDDVLVLVVHHVLADGWSMGVLLEDFARGYRSAPETRDAGSISLVSASGGPTVEPALARWNTRRSTGISATDLDRVAERLRDAPMTLTLPRSSGEMSSHRGRGHRLVFDLTADQAAAVNTLGSRVGVRRSVVLLAVWAVVLARRAAVDDLVMGMPVSGRLGGGVDGAVGLFTRVTPVRCRPTDDRTVENYLRAVNNEYAAAVRDSEIPFEDIVSRLGAKGHRGSNPLVQFAFAAHDQVIASTLDLGDAEATVDEGHAQGAVFDAILYLRHWGEIPRLCIEYGTSVLDPLAVSDLAGALGAALVTFAQDPERKLTGIEFLAPRESDVLNQLATYDEDAAGPGNLWDAVSLASELHADAIAVTDVAAGMQLTYQELSIEVETMALNLIGNGVGVGDRVLVQVDRSAAEIVTLLAILKVGATFVGVPDNTGRPWREEMIRSTGSRFVVTSKANDVWPASLCHLTPWPSMTVNPPYAADDPVVGLHSPSERTPASTAYVSFTSGTTGKPKGIAIPDRAVLRLVRDPDLLKPVGEGQRRSFLRCAPLAFDASTLEIFGPLVKGDRVVVLPPGPATAPVIADCLGRHGVTHMWLTAGLFRIVAQWDPGLFAPLVQLLVGGDVVPRKWVRQVLERCPDLWLTNGYGPTENTTFTTAHHVSSSGEATDDVAIGSPIAGSGVLLLDDWGRRVPPGTKGQLYTTGVGLADGYLGEDERTRASFPQVPLVGERAYATGDLAIVGREGEIRFRGRRDRQIKVGGFRVELKAVEAPIRGWTGVSDAVVGLASTDGVEEVIVAGVVIDDASSMGALIDAVNDCLPVPARPRLWSVVPELPLTANGKVDITALRDVAHPASYYASGEIIGDAVLGATVGDIVPSDAASQTRASHDEEQTKGGSGDDFRRDTHDVVVDVWLELLGHDDFGYDDAFFDVGGDSMQMNEMRDLVRQAFPEAKISTVDIYRAGTVNKLVQRIQEVLEG